MTPRTAGITLVFAVLLVYVGVAVRADTLTITAPRTDVRSGPDLKGAILERVPQGATFSLLETRKGWYKILLADGREGWVMQAVAQVQSRRAIAVPQLAASATQARTALVIGNAAYGADAGALANPGYDATDMATTLQGLGFTVTLVRDATHQRLTEAVDTFSRQLRPGSVGLFYFAGHGVQVDGVNYLIPIGVRLVKAVDVKFQAVPAEWVLARMEETGNALNIMILDACRNAPFMRGWRSTLRGLAPMQATRGSLIAYATAPGSVAADGSGRNGTYTKHLLRFMTEPNLLVDRMFRQVRLAVEHETNGMQIPWESSSLREDFYFNPVLGESTVAPATTTPSPAVPSRPSDRTQVAVGTSPPPPQPPATLGGNDGAEMVLIPAGKFLMGTTEEELTRLVAECQKTRNRDEASCREIFQSELPRHQVALRAFSMDKHEVTNQRFERFVQAVSYRTTAEREGWAWGLSDQHGLPRQVEGATWRRPEGKAPGATTEWARHPVVVVSWDDAEAYCRWAGKRLPTEAEWEYAARAGTQTPYWWGEGIPTTRRVANLADESSKRVFPGLAIASGYNDGHTRTAPVGSFTANPWGLYDVLGNVWEWTADWYDAQYYRSSPEQQPPGPTQGQYKVVRGGSWRNVSALARAAYRGGHAPTERSAIIGFRCVQDVAQ